MQTGMAAGSQVGVTCKPVGNETKQARVGRRTPHRVACRLRWFDLGAERSRSCMGETINLSENGAAVQLGREIAVGTWVEALVPNCNGSPTFVCGAVVHCRRVLIDAYEVGIEYGGEWRTGVC